jgi:hypothetical protein
VVVSGHERIGALWGVEPVTLVEQIAHLRQLTIADPGGRVLDVAVVNALTELADAVEELSGRVAAAGLGRVQRGRGVSGSW